MLWPEEKALLAKILDPVKTFLIEINSDNDSLTKMPLTAFFYSRVERSCPIIAYLLVDPLNGD